MIVHLTFCTLQIVILERMYTNMHLTVYLPQRYK